MVSETPPPGGNAYVFNFIRFDPPSGTTKTAGKNDETCFVYTLSGGPDRQFAETEPKRECLPSIQNKNPQLPDLAYSN